MNWKEITLANRRTIIILASTVAVLLITAIILLCVQSTINPIYKPQSVVAQAEVMPAAISDQDVNQYVNHLHSVIKKEYGAKLDGYKIDTGQLLEDGSWYITTLQIPLKDQWSTAQDVFRVILHEEDNKWQIVAGPSLVFTYADYPGIPKEIVFSANNL